MTDDALGTVALCPECEHLANVSLTVTPAIVAAVPATSDIRVGATGNQTSFGDASSCLPSDDDDDPGLTRSAGSILALLGLRFSSPLAWLGALVLFFLPWVEVKCIDGNGQVKSHFTRTGAQLAWGGKTDIIAPPNRPKVENQAEVEWTIGQIGSAGVLTLYVVGLGCAIVFKAVTIRAPTTIFWLLTGTAGGCVTIVLLLLGSLVALPWDWGFGQSRQIVSYSPWYFGSIAANMWAMMSLVLECCFVQNAGRRTGAAISDDS